jgi:NAD(P)-dependent dehydrogenase (short-subunit alcohol dehydrogenase family)
VAPALDITQNLYLGREQRRKGLLGTVFRKLDKPATRHGPARQIGRGLEGQPDRGKQMVARRSGSIVNIGSMSGMIINRPQWHAPYAQAAEIALSALYLAAEASSFVTGSVLVIDGGYTLW